MLMQERKPLEAAANCCNKLRSAAKTAAKIFCQASSHSINGPYVCECITVHNQISRKRTAPDNAFGFIKSPSNERRMAPGTGIALIVWLEICYNLLGILLCRRREVKVLMSIWKWWHDFWKCDENLYGSIDSYRWENKIEMYCPSSGKRS